MASQYHQKILDGEAPWHLAKSGVLECRLCLEGRRYCERWFDAFAGVHGAALHESHDAHCYEMAIQAGFVHADADADAGADADAVDWNYHPILSLSSI
jgi:hypothetical protein